MRTRWSGKRMKRVMNGVGTACSKFEMGWVPERVGMKGSGYRIE